MQAIRATWTNGRIVPAEPVDRPEGSELIVEPVLTAGKIGLAESQWKDDPESIAAWIEAVQKIEPLIWEEGEFEEYERFRRKSREFNIEAIRKQMKEMPNGDSP
jgi:hypothetical protein